MEILTENELRKMADIIAQNITIRKDADGNSTSRPTTEPEAKIIGNVAYSALWTKNYHNRTMDKDTEQIIKDMAEMALNVSLPGCNGYETIYRPLQKAFDEWEHFASPEKSAQYRELLTKIVTEYTDKDKMLHITPSNYTDYVSPQNLMAMFNGYCDKQDKGGCSFENYIGTVISKMNDPSEINEELRLLNIFKSAISKEAPELMPLFEAQMVKVENNELLPSDVLRVGGYNGLVVDCEQFLKNKYAINLMFATEKEREAGMSAIPQAFYDKPECSSDFANITDNAITYLVHQQGYTLADVYKGLKNPDTAAENKFLKSIVSEIESYPYYDMAEMTALITLSGKSLIETLDAIANGRDYITLPQNTVMGLFDEWQGSGSNFKIELEKDVVIPAFMVKNTQFEGDCINPVHDNNGYTVQETYGFMGHYWHGRAEVTTDAPKLSQEDMKETQATLQKPNKSKKDKADRDREFD